MGDVGAVGRRSGNVGRRRGSRSCGGEEDEVDDGLIINELIPNHKPKWHASLGIRMLGKVSRFRNLEQ